MNRESGSDFKTGVLFLVVMVLGCVTSSTQVAHEFPAKQNQELSLELPQELQSRFQVSDVPTTIRKKRHSRRQRSLASVSVPSRRPAKDPFWVGEKLVFDIKYFGMTAGDFTLEVLPHQTLGSRKAYHFKGSAVTSSLFSVFYRLNDVVETYVDYEGIYSHRFHILLDESKQKRDSLELNDSEKKETFYWNRCDHKTKGYSEIKKYAPIPPFPQDSMSALYYLRTVPLPEGAVLNFPIISQSRTLDATCTVIRRETRPTPLGEISAIVIKLEAKYQGILKRAGDSFLWLTDDERRIPVHLEAKVKIGTVVADLKKIEPGKKPE